MPKVIKVLTGGEAKTISLAPGSTSFAIKGATGKVIKKGYSPYINEETGTWFEYNTSLGQFIDTGVVAEAVSIESIDKTSSEGCVDVYTILLSNGETSEFTVTNAENIFNTLSDEFIVSDDKVLNIKSINTDKIDGLVDLIRKEAVLPSIATDTIPGLVLSSQDENKIVVLKDGTMGITSVNINNLVQTDGQRFVLNGGNSQD